MFLLLCLQPLNYTESKGAPGSHSPVGLRQGTSLETREIRLKQTCV